MFVQRDNAAIFRPRIRKWHTIREESGGVQQEKQREGRAERNRTAEQKKMEYTQNEIENVPTRTHDQEKALANVATRPNTLPPHPPSQNTHKFGKTPRFSPPRTYVHLPFLCSSITHDLTRSNVARASSKDECPVDPPPLWMN